MRRPYALLVASLLAFAAYAPAASAAPLVSQDANPEVSLDDDDGGALDWSMQANPGGPNGLSFFHTGEANPILSLSSNSNVGIGESNALLDLLVHTNITPAIRPEQDNMGGCTAQTWDSGPNEAIFSVPDLTGGSRLPFL